MAPRIDKLVEAWEPILKRAFLDSVYALRSQAQLDLIIRMLEADNFEAAIRAVGLDPVAFRAFDKSLFNAFEAGGNFTSSALPVVKLSDGFKVTFQFNVRNPAAEQWLSQHSSKLVSEITDDTRVMLRDVFTKGMAKGLNPRTVALDVVGRVNPLTGRRENGLLGVTSSQQKWIENYADELASDNPRAALSRTLRDKRFDRAVIKAVESGEAIPASLQNKMVTAYTNRALRYRAENLARSEAMTALHEAQQQSMEQAVQTGAITQQDVKFTWRTASDDRVRDSHETMDGQEVAMGEMFITGDSVPIEFPGDPNAPIEETASCRCFREPSIDFAARLT